MNNNISNATNGLQTTSDNLQEPCYYVFVGDGSTVKRCKNAQEVIEYCQELIDEDGDTKFSDLKFDPRDNELDISYEIFIVKGKPITGKASIVLQEEE